MNVGMESTLVTHSSNLLRIIGSVYLQHLDRNLQSTVFTPPYIRKPTATVRGARRVVAWLDL